MPIAKITLKGRPRNVFIGANVMRPTAGLRSAGSEILSSNARQNTESGIVMGSGTVVSAISCTRRSFRKLISETLSVCCAKNASTRPWAQSERLAGSASSPSFCISSKAVLNFSYKRQSFRKSGWFSERVLKRLEPCSTGKMSHGQASVPSSKT